ncbi:hypothetical protein GWK47_020280 [Chionoecetes opilio]|uniref:Uncharacterized protein n=1 Tax=Chionoecetes opilio TaxID=41210 RepID=A0A8J5CKX7_CHIOP|nr:hypothetical protein GWK47_020280 [Chionoecetes opilio]
MRSSEAHFEVAFGENYHKLANIGSKWSLLVLHARISRVCRSHNKGCDMALSEVNITHLPLPLSTAKRLISRKCRSAWDRSLGDALRATSMGGTITGYCCDLDSHTMKSVKCLLNYIGSFFAR